MSYTYIFTILLLILVIISKKESSITFDRSSTGVLRGIAMLLIIVHHIEQNIGNYSIVSLHSGYLATGLFFFISGYGNQLSIYKHNSITIKWLFNKIRKLYSTYFVGFVVYCIILNTMYKELALSLTSIIRHLIMMSLPNQVSWFPKMIIMCFIIHWITSRFVHRYTSVLCIAIFASIIIIMHYYHIPSYWYNSFICYPFGMIFADNSKKIEKNPRLKAIICGALFLIMFIYFPIRVLLTVVLSVFVYYLTAIYDFESKLLEFIGNNSFEFYIFHLVCIQAFAFLSKSYPIAYGFCVFNTSIVFVLVYLTIKQRYKRVSY